MISFIAKTSFLALIIAPCCAVAQIDLRVPNWDREMAMETAYAPQSAKTLEGLVGLLQAGDMLALEQQLEAIIKGSLSSQPRRDYVLHQFATTLGDAPQTQAWMLDRLAAVEPSVYVPHPDKPGIGVPLFNIRAAAEGARGHVARGGARQIAGNLLVQSPEAWVGEYLSASLAERKGFTDALVDADDGPLQSVLSQALELLPISPELTPIAGRAALLLGDEDALQSVVTHGSGADLAGILAAASSTLDKHAALSLFDVAVTQAPPENAALAIAQLYPALAGIDSARSTLLDLLADRDLGASAALALAQDDDPGLLAALESIARTDNGLAASRANLALDTINNAGRMGQ